MFIYSLFIVVTYFVFVNIFIYPDKGTTKNQNERDKITNFILFLWSLILFHGTYIMHTIKPEVNSDNY